jgi:crossover junction endodeoxyribonuclease RuvC
MDTALSTFIGVDPGLSGAVAIINGDSYFVYDIPTMLKGSGTVKYEINAKGMADIFRTHVASPPMAAIERVNAMPGQGVASVFSLGDSFGSCRAVLACQNIPTLYITPITWKKYYKLTSDKEEARALAIKLFPNAELHLKKHIDRAEALLIANYLKECHDKAVHA